MNKQEFIRMLDRAGACDNAVDWCIFTPQSRFMYNVYRKCNRGTWMCWLVCRAANMHSSKILMTLRNLDANIYCGLDDKDMARFNHITVDHPNLSTISSIANWRSDAGIYGNSSTSLNLTLDKKIAKLFRKHMPYRVWKSIITKIGESQ